MNRNYNLFKLYRSVILAICALAVFPSIAVSASPEIAKSQAYEFAMYPTIKCGECIVYKNVSISDLKKGDIVVYIDASSGRKICHRVDSIEGEGIWTKGDNNRFRDRRVVSKMNLLGLVTHVDGRSVL
jgi:signal peptidase I